MERKQLRAPKRIVFSSWCPGALAWIDPVETQLAKPSARSLAFFSFSPPFPPKQRKQTPGVPLEARFFNFCHRKPETDWIPIPSPDCPARNNPSLSKGRVHGRGSEMVVKRPPLFLGHGCQKAPPFLVEGSPFKGQPKAVTSTIAGLTCGPQMFAVRVNE